MTARVVTASGHRVVVAGGSVEETVVLVVAPYRGIAVDGAIGALVYEEDMLTNQLDDKIKKKNHKLTQAKNKFKNQKSAACVRSCVMKGRFSAGLIEEMQASTEKCFTLICLI